MARTKNALTGYFVGAWDDATPPTDATLELAKWIRTVTDDSDETVDQTAYYDGDGTLEDDVTALKFTYGFEGFYDPTDVAQKFIADLEFKDGSYRKIAFKQVRTDGTVYFGKATVSAIRTTGGDAEEYQPFTCTISWDQLPTITPPGP